MKKVKVTLYLEPQYKELLDSIYKKLDDSGNKKTYGDIVGIVLQMAAQLESNRKEV